MRDRTADDRRAMRRARRETGASSVRVTNATKALLKELVTVIPPYELRGEDELLWELAAAELERRKQLQTRGQLERAG